MSASFSCHTSWVFVTSLNRTECSKHQLTHNNSHHFSLQAVFFIFWSNKLSTALLGHLNGSPEARTETHLLQKSHPRPQMDDITAKLGCNPSACVEGRPLRWTSASGLCALNIQPGAACCSACWEPPCGHRGAPSPPSFPPHRQHSPSASIYPQEEPKQKSVKQKYQSRVLVSHTHNNRFIPLTFVTPPAHRPAAAVEDNEEEEA